jgi:cytochrome c biogenesis protein CcmG, thiol:disulfide interchange protein DsbE
MNPAFMIRMVPLLLLLLVSMLLASGLFNSDDNASKSSRLIGYDMVPFHVPALGSQETRFAPQDWKGKVVVLNVFATWCKPCLKEHPVWMNLSKQGKANIYGLAWKDTAEKVSEWLNRHGNPYHLIGVDQIGAATIPLALTGVPETFIIGPTGTIFYHHRAPITQELVDKVIVPMVEKITSGELQPAPRMTDANSSVPLPGPIEEPQPATR